MSSWCSGCSQQLHTTQYRVRCWCCPLSRRACCCPAGVTRNSRSVQRRPDKKLLRLDLNPDASANLPSVLAPSRRAPVAVVSLSLSLSGVGGLSDLLSLSRSLGSLLAFDATRRPAISLSLSLSLSSSHLKYRSSLCFLRIYRPQTRNYYGCTLVRNSFFSIIDGCNSAKYSEDNSNLN